MKKTLLFNLFCIIALALVYSDGYSQGCLVVKDSVIAGPGSSRFKDYYYDVSYQIIKAEQTDSAGTQPNSYDTLYYNGSGELVKLESFYSGTSTPARTTNFTYTSGRISRVDVSGTNNQGAWTLAHDLTYDGSGNIQSVILDTTAVTGNPDGFTGSFINPVWQNGNATTVDLVIGTDTLELIVTSDSKNNVMKKLYPNEAPTLFLMSMTHNIVKIVFANSENFGPAGTVLLNHAFTYNSNNDDVATETDSVALFDKDTHTTQYFYDCSSGIHLPEAYAAVNIYPNPANDVIYFEQMNLKGEVKIFDINGKEIKRQTVVGQLSSLNVSDLKPGVYYIEMTDGQKVFKGKVLKN